MNFKNLFDKLKNAKEIEDEDILSLKHLKCFEYENCKQKSVKFIKFLPKSDFVAVAVNENFNFLERIEISGRSFKNSLMI